MPKSRVYAVENRDGNGSFETYKGFDRKFSPASEVEHVALVSIDGEIDVYVIDDPKRVGDFMKYLADEGYENPTILGIYTRR